MRRARAACACAAAAVLVLVAAAPAVMSPASAAEAPDPTLVNDELVVSTLDLSGLPLSSTLINRLVAVDRPMETYADPISTANLRYVDRPGSPPVSNGEAMLSVGGPGVTSVTTSSTFDRPLPVALNASYERGGAAVDPATLEGSDGEVVVTYTVTNTTVAKEKVEYRDSAGQSFTRTDPVFVPFAGTLLVTVPAGIEVRSAPDAVPGTTPEGLTTLRWNLVLAPPLGSYQQTHELVMRATSLAVPSVRMEVVPTTTSADPSAAFAASLLDSSVKGNASLAEGLTTLDDNAAELAAGAGSLSRGLAELEAGAAALTQGADDQLVPGAQQIASGSAQVATGAGSLATGVDDAAEAAAQLDAGLTSLVAGLAEIESGLAALAGSSGLPAAQAAAVSLGEAVGQIADVVGSPSDPPVTLRPRTT
jgi:putative membrane protein